MGNKFFLCFKSALIIMFHGENCHGLFQTWEIGRYAGNVCEKWKTDEFQEEQMDFLSSNSFLMMEKSMMFLWTKLWRDKFFEKFGQDI